MSGLVRRVREIAIRRNGTSTSFHSVFIISQVFLYNDINVSINEIDICKSELFYAISYSALIVVVNCLILAELM